MTAPASTPAVLGCLLKTFAIRISGSEPNRRCYPYGSIDPAVNFSGIRRHEHNQTWLELEPPPRPESLIS